jgi:hypothetical protein
MNETIAGIVDGDNLLWIIGGAVAMLAIASSAIRSIVASVTRERTRRDIAAYIAEGTMTPEQGERLMAAGEPKKSSCC